MKASAFPVILLVENELGEVLFEQRCTNTSMLQRTYIKVKSLYPLEANWNIFFVCNSKVNDTIPKIRGGYKPNDV
jgi:hypothetical protein